VARLRPPDIDENRSLWADLAAPLAPFAPLAGDTTADVAIIGGGFTGVSRRTT